MKAGLLTVLKLGNRPTGEELSTGKVMKGFMSRPDCIIREGVRTNAGSVLLWQELPAKEEEGESWDTEETKLTKLQGQNIPSSIHSCIHEESKRKYIREWTVIRGNSSSSSLAKEAEYLSALGRKTGTNRDRTERKVDRESKTDQKRLFLVCYFPMMLIHPWTFCHNLLFLIIFLYDITDTHIICRETNSTINCNKLHAKI